MLLLHDLCSCVSVFYCFMLIERRLQCTSGIMMTVMGDISGSDFFVGSCMYNK